MTALALFVLDFGRTTLWDAPQAPVQSAQDAIRAAIVAEHRSK